jgi:hypothetical protein
MLSISHFRRNLAVSAVRPITGFAGIAPVKGGNNQ